MTSDDYRLPDKTKKRTSPIASVPTTASGTLGMGASSTMLSGGSGGGGYESLATAPCHSPLAAPQMASAEFEVPLMASADFEAPLVASADFEVPLMASADI